MQLSIFLHSRLSLKVKSMVDFGFGHFVQLDPKQTNILELLPIYLVIVNLAVLSSKSDVISLPIDMDKERWLFRAYPKQILPRHVFFANANPLPRAQCSKFNRLGHCRFIRRCSEKKIHQKCPKRAHAFQVQTKLHQAFARCPFVRGCWNDRQISPSRFHRMHSFLRLHHSLFNVLPICSSE